MRPVSERLVIESARFGRIELEPENLIRFDGLPGFPAARRFALLRHDQESLFGWLVCADEPELGFAVTDPRQFFPDYAPGLEPAYLRAVEGEESGDVELLAIANVREGEIHLNLAAPLLLNPSRRRGAQVILESGGLTTRVPVRPAPPSEQES